MERNLLSQGLSIFKVQMIMIYTQVEPSLVVDMQFQRPKRLKDKRETPAKRAKLGRTATPHSSEIEETFLKELEKMSPPAVLLSSVKPFNTTTPATVPVIRKLPLPLTSLQKDIYAAMTR